MRQFGWHRFGILLALMGPLLALYIALLPTRPLYAQPPDNELGEMAPFLILFPELRTLPAPAWFRPGGRATYQSMSAIMGGGGAGAGIIHYDTVASDGLQSIVSVQTFANNGLGNLVPLSGGLVVGLPALGEIWLHPQALTRAEEVANSNLTVTRLSKVVNGETLPVVRFQSSTANGTARTVWEFDAISGILLFYSNSTPSPSTGTSQETQLTFLHYRVMTLPWAAGRAPNWARRNVTMGFSGKRTLNLAGGLSVDQPQTMNAKIEVAAPTWSIMSLATRINNIDGGTGLSASGVGQLFASMWLPREALDVDPGQTPVTIDTDPATGAVITLHREANGFIVLQQFDGANSHYTALVYNPALGSLDRFIQVVRTSTEETITDVSRTSGDDLAAINALPELPNNSSNPSDPSEPGEPSNPQDPSDPKEPSEPGDPSGSGNHGLFIPTLRR